MWHETVEELASSVRRYALQSARDGHGAEDVSGEIAALEKMGLFGVVPTASVDALSEAVPYVAAAGRELSASPAAAAFWSATASRIALANARSAAERALEVPESFEEGARSTLRLSRREVPRCAAQREEDAGAATPGSPWRVSGAVTGLLGLEGARRLLVRAHLDGMPPGSDEGLLLVEVPADGLASRQSWAASALTTVRLNGEKGVLVAAGDDATLASICERAVAQAAVLQCVDLLALAGRCLADTIQYMRVRQQFGKPLAALPVVRSHLADAQIDLAVSEAVTGVALASLADRAAGAHRTGVVALLAARLSVQKRTERVVLIANQLTGGVGYYEDYPLASVTRSFIVRSRMFGRRADLEAIAARLLGEPGFRVETVKPLRSTRHLPTLGDAGRIP